MLKHNKYVNKKVISIYGDILFDEKGESRNLDEVYEKNLGKLPNYTFVSESKKESPVKEEKSEPKKKVATKKTVAKKVVKKATNKDK